MKLVRVHSRNPQKISKHLVLFQFDLSAQFLFQSGVYPVNPGLIFSLPCLHFSKHRIIFPSDNVFVSLGGLEINGGFDQVSETLQSRIQIAETFQISGLDHTSSINIDGLDDSGDQSHSDLVESDH